MITITVLRTLAAMLTVILETGLSQISAPSSIAVSHAGYRLTDAKTAFSKAYGDGTFLLLDTVSGSTVFVGKVNPIGTTDAATGDTLFELDFTRFERPGVYRISLPSIGAVSSTFHLDDSVYRPAFLSTLTSFYYQRCGVDVSNGTRWKHPTCHRESAVVYDEPRSRVSSRGGWHDAGDYNKFVPSTAVSAGFLMSLYEWDPARWTDGMVNIPEAGNGVPDLLDEIRWGLTWLCTMQRSDGGVYHKVSIRRWTDEHLPHLERDKQFVFNVSSTATGAFAAVAAQGARLFSAHDPDFSARLLRSATRAWEFLQSHPAIVPPGGFKNPPDVEGGEYGDTEDADERLWAAAELYRTTGNRVYHDDFLTAYRRLGGVRSTVSWQRVHNFAYYSYLRIAPESVDLNARAFIIASLTSYADRLLQRIDASGYGYVLTPEEYYWGSNSVALGYAFDLLHAAAVTGSRRYEHAAVGQLQYILGKNPFDLSFVTGFGPRAVRHPYHQFSMLAHAGDPVPGMVVGGANKGSRLGGRTISTFPGRCYEDNRKNYFVNETAINYTAPFVFVSGVVSMGGEQSAASEQKVSSK